MLIRFMSYNIQHGFDYTRKDGIRLEAAAEEIIRRNPDIVGLNEVRNGPIYPVSDMENPAPINNNAYFDQTKYLADLTGMRYYYFGRSIGIMGGEYGNAILSRFPIKKCEVFSITTTQNKSGINYEPRTILKATITLPYSFSVYVSHFGVYTPEERENGVALLLSLTSSADKPFVFMGDLNATPDSEELKPLFSSLTDTASLLYPDSHFYTYPSDAPDKKIDYIFVSHGARCISADVEQTYGASDHRPYTAVIDL